MKKHNPRYCLNCLPVRTGQAFCPKTRRETPWTEDETGLSRTISGGLCLKVEEGSL